MTRARHHSRERSRDRVGKAKKGAAASQPSPSDSVPNLGHRGSLLFIDDMGALPCVRLQLAHELQDHATVWFSLAHPYTKTIQLFDEHGIRHDKTFFIDTISDAGPGKPVGRIGNALLMHDASDLTGMAMALDAALQEMPGERYIVLSCLSELHLYNSTPVALNFLQLLTERAREAGTHLIALAPRGHDEEFVNQCRGLFEQVTENHHKCGLDSEVQHFFPMMAHRPGRAPQRGLLDTAAWLLVAVIGVLALSFGASHLSRLNPAVMHWGALAVLITLQLAVACFIAVARWRSTWHSGVYEWLLAGILLYLGHSTLEALASLGTLENAMFYASAARLLAMGCFLMAALKMKALAKRYGFLDLDWVPIAQTQDLKEGRPAP